MTLLDAKRRAIVNALAATGGEFAQAAAVLDIGRSTLWKKIKELEIDPAEYGCAGRRPAAVIPLRPVAGIL